jgi:drug/metabolite transporter (DMT)-like permease
VLAVLYLGVAVSVGAYGLYNLGVSRLPAWQASAYTNLIPVFALVLGWAFLDEAVTVSHVVGIAAVCLGVGLTQRRG